MAVYNNILKRVSTSLLLVGLVLMVINWLYLSAALVTIFIVLGLYEFFVMVEKKGIEVYRYFGMVVGTLIPLSILFKFTLNTSWQLFLIVIAIIILILMQLRRHQSSGAISGISTTIFGILYISWFLSFLIRIRYMPEGR
ncbi:MAG: phosphatidate cytidylyltransferase, partial [Candidatus Omnitrophica bacterium]|nr:phosphatidate cytidylyltransferase [Candidatus Omnitrophota bacterium]